MTTTLGASARPPSEDPLDPSDLPTPTTPAPTGPGGRDSPRRGRWFGAFWRWHFYAAFLVVPVLALLAVTGLIYLFRFQVEPLLRPDLMTVSVPADAQVRSYDQQLKMLESTLEEEGRSDYVISTMTEPRTPSEPSRFTVTLDNGEARDYFVDPYELAVLGSVDPDKTISGAAILLHSELMVGPVGGLVLELGACWAIVMAITGYVLFFKGRAARRRARTRDPARARLRHWHALSGVVAGVVLLGLLVSGLPWTDLWGAQTQKIATSQGSSFWSDDHGALSNPATTLDESLPHSHQHDVPWGMGKTERPRSSAAKEGQSVANLDTIKTVAEQEGLAHPITIVLPQEADGTYSAIAYAFNDPGQERTVHIDQYSGEVVSRYGYGDYAALAKTVAQGIALHEGRRLGVINMALSTAGCLLILFLCISGPIMWWRRRPRGSGSLGAPRAKMPIKATPVLAVVLVALGIFLPLFGASVIILLLVDQLVLRRVPRLGRWFDVRA